MIDSILQYDLYANTQHAPTCLDLFSGAGGLSIGFAMAGGRPLGGVDFDKDSIQTYKRNFPLAADTACQAIEQWNPKTKPGAVDVIIGGPPCQGFSLARGQRFVDDPRNSLYKYFVKIVGIYKPKWIVMENVEGITNIGDGLVLKQILEDFERIGYELEYKVVNMALYGVPQKRKRAIFVGNRIGCKYSWPVEMYFDPKQKMTNGNINLFQSRPVNSVNYALSDLLLPQGNFFSHRANSQMRGPRNRCAHTDPAFTLRVRGDEFALCENPAIGAFIPGLAPSEEIVYRAPQNELQELLRMKQPKWITGKITKGSRRKSLPRLSGTRRLTIREQARLQTFPDWVTFDGKITSQAKQIGNAVPPLFAFQLFRELFKSF